MAGKSAQPQQAAFARPPAPPRKMGDRDGWPKAGVSHQFWVLHIN